MTGQRQAVRAGVPKSDPGHWAELTGMCAKALGRSRSANPYKRQSAHWQRWLEGHTYFTVSREAMKHPKLGRGRSKLGLRREWSVGEIATLLAYAGEEQPHQIAARLTGRNSQVVRNKLHRIRKEEARRHG